MRFHAVIYCLATAFLPQLALAADPPGQLGALQAVFDYCVKVDSTQTAKLEHQVGMLLKGLSPAQVAALRKTAEYQRGYKMLAGVLPEVKGNDAIEACQAISGGHV